MRQRHWLLTLVLGLALAGCSDDGDGGTVDVTDDDDVVVDAEEPGDYHELVSWSTQARFLGRVNPTFFCVLPLPGQSELNAAEADPSRGALYERVLSAYLSPAIDPTTGAYRTSEPCAPMQIFAESIIDDDAFQGEVEGRLGSLRGKPYSLLFGLSDPLFGALRCKTRDHFALFHRGAARQHSHPFALP